MWKMIGELHVMLIEYEKDLPKKAETPQVMMIKDGKIQKANKKSLKAKGKGKTNGKGKDKQDYIPKPKNPKPAAKEHPAKDDTCHHCKECFTDFGISVSKNNVFYFNVIPSNGIYEIDMHDLLPNVNSIYNVSTKRAKHNLDSTYLWHCRLAHISKKRIKKLQQEGLLKSTDDESFDQCVSCLSGKITRKSFPPRLERASDLFGIMHTDVCGLLRHVSRQGASHFITFTDDYSRYGYDYLLKHKHEVWGCEALVKRDMPDKLQQRSVKRIFIGYPRETMGYYFYFLPENKIVVARYAEFFEKNLITQEVSGRTVDLEEIQDEDILPSEITSEIPMKVEGFEPPQEEVILIRRYVRTHQAPDRLCLNVEVEEHSLWDLNEPVSHKAAMLDSESNKWIDAMNVEIQSMLDNVVWVLVDLPPNCKTVRSKWIFKKKTDIDDIVHTYKARLIAKGYTQLYGVDYEETFSPIADIRAIRILISIAAFYDYEIWQMDASGSNVTFLILYVDEMIIMGNHIPSLQSVKGYFGKCFAMKDLGEAAFILRIKIYRDRSKRLIGLGQNAYMDKILKRYKMDNSKRSNIPMQEKLDLNKTQGASTPKEDSGELHWTVVKNILKYLINTKSVSLVYGGNPEAKLRVDFYCDAGFETDIDDIISPT
nr:retrotransposon protein, putative, Ty1-copia subclass [Tanacetum cinerariifolium]